MRCNKTVSVATSLCLFFSSTSAYSAVEPRYRIGITRLGEGDTSLERAYDRLEKRLVRWIENDPSLQLQADALGPAERTWSSIRSLRKNLEDRGRAALGDPQTLMNPQWENLIRRLEPIQELAPDRQRARLIQAWVAFLKKENSEAKRYLAMALAQHPEGILSDVASAGLGSEAFQNLVSEVGSDQKRGCSVELDIFPPDATVGVDGFVFGGRRKFALLRGKAYRATISAYSFESQEIVLDCRRAGQWIEKVRLEKSRRPAEPLDRMRWLTEKHGVSSLLFAEARGKDRFELSVYTPGVGIDTLASLEQGDSDGHLPISMDALSGILERHHSRPSGVLSTGQEEKGYLVNAFAEKPKEDPAWFERRSVWIGVATVVLGVAAAFALRSSRGDQSGSVGSVD